MYFSRYSVSIQGNLIRSSKERASWANRWCTSQKTITPETILALYKKLEADLPGKVAVKIHSGEEGNQNYLRPEYVAPLVAEVNGALHGCSKEVG